MLISVLNFVKYSKSKKAIIHSNSMIGRTMAFTFIYLETGTTAPLYFSRMKS